MELNILECLGSQQGFWMIDISDIYFIHRARFSNVINVIVLKNYKKYFICIITKICPKAIIGFNMPRSAS